MAAPRLPLFGLFVLLAACGGPPDCTDPDTVSAIQHQLFNMAAKAMGTDIDAGRHALDVESVAGWRKRHCVREEKEAGEASTKRATCRKGEALDWQVGDEARHGHPEISPAAGLLAYLMANGGRRVRLGSVETEHHDDRNGSYTCMGTLSITPPEPVESLLEQPAGRAALHNEVPRALVWFPEPVTAFPTFPPAGLLADPLHLHDPNALTVEQIIARQKTPATAPMQPAVQPFDGDIYSLITYVSGCNVDGGYAVKVTGLEPLSHALKAISDPKKFASAVQAARRKAAADAARRNAVQNAWRQADKALGLRFPLPLMLPPISPPDPHATVGSVSKAPYPAPAGQAPDSGRKLAPPIGPKPDQDTQIPLVTTQLPELNGESPGLGLARGGPPIIGANSQAPHSCPDGDSICLQLEADRLLALETKLYQQALGRTASAAGLVDLARTEKDFSVNREMTCARSPDRLDKARCDVLVTRMRILQLHGNPDAR